MKQRIFLSILLTAIVLTSFSPAKIGIFENNADVGKPKLAGSSRYDAAGKAYILKGSGYNIWFERDEFQYLFRELSGDFTVTADFEMLGKGTDAHRKVGWMVRESTDGDASHLSAVVHGDGLTVLQWRVAKGDKMRDPEDEIFSKEKNIQTVQVERKGNAYTMRAATKGAPLKVVGSHEMANLKEKVLVGLFICSHNPEVIEEAKVSNVVITKAKK
jgi:regulation of enolase protein 1 (concanavalin A-like superfamily)